MMQPLVGFAPVPALRGRLAVIAERRATVVLGTITPSQETDTEHIVFADIRVIGVVIIPIMIADIRHSTVGSCVDITVIIRAVAGLWRGREDISITVVAVAIAFAPTVIILVSRGARITAFIDVAVAVIVDAVPWTSWLRATILRHSGIHVGVRVIAIKDSGVGGAHGVAIGVEVKVLIDQAVAVIIVAIASLRRPRIHRAVAVIAVITLIMAVEVRVEIHVAADRVGRRLA